MRSAEQYFGPEYYINPTDPGGGGGAAPPLEQESPREDRVRQILETSGAFLTGHFLLKSGRHSDRYVNKDAVYPHPEETKELCAMFAEDFRDMGVEVVVGPALGGILLSHDTAGALTQITGQEVPGVYAEKQGEGFAFTRGYDNFVRGKRALVVEDILTTGGSARQVIDLVRNTGGEVVGLAAIVNRGGVTPDAVGVDVLKALIQVGNFQTWQAGKEDCPKCQEGLPLDNGVGHARTAQNPQST